MGGDFEITAVEHDAETAAVYQDHFPNDKVLVMDAHQYLLDHFKEYDFIWSSPPCPSHSRLNTFLYSTGGRSYEYPDMKLYEEILFLKHWFKGKYVVENVVPYYQALIPAKEIDRHLFWTNFPIGNFGLKDQVQIKASDPKVLEKRYGFDLSGFKLKDRRKTIRNCVHPETGKYMLDCAMNKISNPNPEQLQIF